MLILDGEQQHPEAPRSSVGTEGTNILRLLNQLMNVVEQFTATAASQNHGASGPTNTETFTGHSQQAAYPLTHHRESNQVKKMLHVRAPSRQHSIIREA